MRGSWRLFLRVVLLVALAVLVWMRFAPHRRVGQRTGNAVEDLSVTNPMNQPGGGPAPAEAYEVYSELYRAPTEEPLAIAADSATDIPQVGGSCLKPATPDEREMTDAFVAANRQTHRWETKFRVPASYRLLSPEETMQAQSCLATHGRDAAKCDIYKDLRHVRFLGVPGFNQTHTQALVSVLRKCGGFCGSGGIFVVEKKGGQWTRAETTDFTRDCSWAY